MRSDHVTKLRARIRAMSIADAPPPWRQVVRLGVGALQAVGLGDTIDTTELALVVAAAGRGVVDCRDGRVLIKISTDDPAAAVDVSVPAVVGVGPFEDRFVPVAGVWGGGLTRQTTDGWRVQSIPVDWPEQRIVLEPPGTSVLVDAHAKDCVLLLATAADLRAVGFSRTGESLLVATASDFTIFGRA